MERIRTLADAAAYFKAADPETAITKTAIRRAVVDELVPSMKVGKKWLVSLDALERYFSGLPLEEERPEPEKKRARVVYARRYM